MFDGDVIEEIRETAKDFGLEPASLLAVAEIESGGVPYSVVDGKKEPLIRFEGHYFDARLSGKKQAQARAAGLAAPQAGRIRNPSTQAARWRLLARAEAIDHAAALESTSWGLGQVMGAHWSRLGYKTVDALVADARDSVAGQARLAARFIKQAGLSVALHDHDWAAFARGYNGPLFARSAYDRRLADAYARYARTGPATGQRPALLCEGASGEAVANLQRLLIARGCSLSADGVFGPRTAAALRAFQREHALAEDAVAGPLTFAALKNV